MNDPTERPGDRTPKRAPNDPRDEAADTTSGDADPHPAGTGPDDGPADELVALALAVLANDHDRLAAAVAGARPDRRWRETMLMTALFAGVPRVVAAWGRLARLLPADALGPLEADELQEQSNLDAAGATCFGHVYGDAADDVHATLHGYHPLLARWIREFAYGRVLAREGLSLGERELVAVACLAALALPRQLASHVRGAKRAGVPDRHVRRALEAGLPLAPSEDHEALRAVGARFLLDG